MPKLIVPLGLALLLLASSAMAATYSELGDAGELPGTAQIILSGVDLLTDIYGSVRNNNADLFQIFLMAGTPFSARTTQPGLLNAFDTSLFLFTLSGNGIVANDDDAASGGDHSLIRYTPPVTGYYLIAIAGSGYEPVSAGGFIFPQVNFTSIQPYDIRGPTGPGGTSPVSGWSGSYLAGGGAYDIAIEGAFTVPEPATRSLLLLAIALGVVCTSRKRRISLIVVLTLAFVLPVPRLQAQGPEARLGHGLKTLVAEQFGQTGSAAGEFMNPLTGPASRIRRDAQGRVLVDIYLDGKITVVQAQGMLALYGARVTGAVPTYRQGLISAFIPVSAAVSLANTAGIQSILLARRPVTHAGRVTSQAAVVHRSDLVNASGFTGAGITVGILSDSYNTAGEISLTDAALDVATGDLPDTNIAAPGLKFLIEGPSVDDGAADEGRGMAQLVFDMAPGAQLCFATAFESLASFAENIRTLRTNPACAADIIVDDILYFAEPMFSDGAIAQAVEDVVNSTRLAGKPVSYFSSAGNEGRFGYTSDFRFVPKAVALALSGQG
jgi:hypothetical protein